MVFIHSDFILLDCGIYTRGSSIASYNYCYLCAC